jgi:acyl carrier protein
MQTLIRNERLLTARSILDKAVESTCAIDITHENPGRRLVDMGIDSLDNVAVIMEIERVLKIEALDSSVRKIVTIRDAIYFLEPYM